MGEKRRFTEVWTVTRNVAGNTTILGVYATRHDAVLAIEADSMSWLKVAYEFQFHAVDTEVE